MDVIVADEHVPAAAVHALRSAGHDVVRAQERYERGTADAALLERCADDGRVLLTNDTDLVALHGAVDHAGVIVYTSQELQPESFVRGVERITAAYPEGLAGRIEWLEGWL